MPRCLFLILTTLFTAPAIADTIEDQRLEGALNLYLAGSYQDAIQELTPLAEAGRSEAQYVLGTMYHEGQAGPQDTVRAYSWLLRASRLQNTKAQEAMADLALIMSRDQMLQAQSMAEDERIALNAEYGCVSFFGENFASHYVNTYRSQAPVDQMVDDILKYTGLSKNFTIRAANVPNAAAVIHGSTRYLLFNPRFIGDVNNIGKTAWSAYSVMAHEIGHHLQGHTITPGGSRPPTELEADFFSGFVLAKMGAEVDDAQALMSNYANRQGSSTHPGRADRLAAIANGWRNAKDQEAPPSTAPSTPPPPSRRSRTKKTSPTTKVHFPTPPTPPRNATVCVTQYGHCRLVVPLPSNTVCYCVSRRVGYTPGYTR